MNIVKLPGATAEAAIARMERARERSERGAEKVARRVIADVRRHGDAAASRLVAQFDGVSIPDSEMRLSVQGCPIEEPISTAIDLAIERIDRFHRQQMPSGYSVKENATELRHRVRPLRRIGIYAPGGSAVYLSTLIMCAVPARQAGVAELVVATTPFAADRPEFRECCKRLGVSEIYRAGGPAGIAAMALGTATLRRVDKIVGPGNSYVTAAKKLLVGKVGIDMLAGPTELVIIADDQASAERVAADLLAQAEHGSDSAVTCITFNLPTARRVAAEVERQLAKSDSPIARSCIDRNGLIVIVPSAQESVALANRIAPEHLSLHWNEASTWIDQLENCGAIFVGDTSPVAAGDYVAGPNHVLPTGGTARFTSPLGVYDFVKRSNILQLSEELLGEIGPAGERMARFEGLPLHGLSLSLRVPSPRAEIIGGPA